MSVCVHVQAGPGHGRGVDVLVALLFKELDGDFFYYGFGDFVHHLPILP